MEELRPNGQRAKNAMLLIWIVMAIELVALISKCFQYNLLQTAVNGGVITTDEAIANDTTEQTIAILYLIVYIISAVTFIQWFRRAYYNLHLKTEFLSHSEGWAAGSWFVPIISLYRPVQIMRELYEETESYLTEKGLNIDDKLKTNMLTPWWTLWIISNILGRIISKYPTNSIDDLINSTIASIVLNIIGIPLALIAIKIIKDYSSVEPLLIETEINEKQLKTKELLVESNLEVF
ncbi:DUF4328 domain-containing protein [Flavobacterium sp. AJR]|uniref:DUF4328 domain-containing protein n=1 Tax=Flavobacterium sp. AJR TaxID=1979369 RepID=UPI000A3D80A2|nr:DUF4328 domain-containing protein [Flavobacterium sp. AJR]OUL60563.1 hypothetical protein B8T70_19845 [Flavobacterium sp. AJR]